jgi:tetratricopeptide (TPR) repeat protein
MQTITRDNIVYTFLFVLFFISNEAFAKTENDEQQFLSEHTYTILTNVHESMTAEDYPSALEKINDLLLDNNIKPYDMAVIQQTKGYIYNAQGKNNEAIQAFVSALRENALPDDVAHLLHYLIAQLLISTESYKKGLEFLDKWFRNEPKPDAEAHMLAASAHYQTGNFKKMIPHVQKALGKVDQPPQSWYEILLAGYYETKAYRKAADLLETMVINYPDKDDYWPQLAGMYQRLKDEKKALAVNELAYAKGILKGDEILQLVKSYLYYQMPYRAANILENELQKGSIKKTKESLVLLTDSWLLAQETGNAMSVLTEAAEKSNDPSLYFRLGKLSIELESWSQAVIALESAIRMGNINNIGEAYMLLGIAAFHINDRLRSIRAFNIALTYDDIREKAEWWWEHLY